MTLFTLNSISKNTLMETLNIEFTELGDEYVIAKMPVNERVFQPYQYLHGGATLGLIETVGSAVSLLKVNFEKFDVFANNINAHHLKSTQSGEIFAKANLIKAGKMLHLVEIEVKNEKGELLSYATQTNIVKEKQQNLEEIE